jgi:hypothetical protein
MIRVYDEVGNVIERQEHTGDFKEPSCSKAVACARTCWHQLWVKVAVSVMGSPIVIEAGLFDPE